MSGRHSRIGSVALVVGAPDDRLGGVALLLVLVVRHEEAVGLVRRLARPQQRPLHEQRVLHELRIDVVAKNHASTTSSSMGTKRPPPMPKGMVATTVVYGMAQAVTRTCVLPFGVVRMPAYL